MVEVVVVGASGFGREALDTLEAMISAGTEATVLGVVDDSPSEVNLQRLADRNIKYLGTIDSWLDHTNTDVRFVLGIGNPQVRKRLVERIEGRGFRPLTVIHPSTVIGSQTEPSDGLVVCGGAVISTNVRFGRHVHVNPNATIGHDTVLGDYVSINPNATVSGEVHIESEVLVGASATILQGLKIGGSSCIGAGALCNCNIPSSVTAKGIPARWQT